MPPGNRHRNNYADSTDVADVGGGGTIRVLQDGCGKLDSAGRHAMNRPLVRPLNPTAADNGDFAKRTIAPPTSRRGLHDSGFRAPTVPGA